MTLNDDPVKAFASVLDASSRSRALDPLERDGLIVREIGSSRRSLDIRITPAGLQKIKEAAPLWIAARQVFVSIIGSGNMGAFEDILERTSPIEELNLEAPKQDAQKAA